MANENQQTKELQEEFDPLLECLVLFTELNNRPFSAEALTAGLPTQPGRTRPELFSIKGAKGNFSRAAARAGFTSRLVKRSLEEISPLVLPCILVLKGKNACILTGFDDEKKFAKIIMPEAGDTVEWVAMEDLAQEYMGFAFYLKKELHFEEAPHGKVNEEKASHWFWGTLWRNRDLYRDVIIASLMINLFVLATPLFTMNVYDRVVPNNAVETLWVLALGVSVIYIFDMLIKFVRTYFLEIAGKKSDIIMSSLLFEKTMDLKMAAKPKSVGSFANNLKEFESIRSFFTSSTVAALIDLPFVFIFLFTVYYIAGHIAIVPLITMFLILVYTFTLRGPLHRSIESTFKAASQKNAVLIESLTAMETIKSLGAAGNAQWKWEEVCGEIASKGIKSKILATSITTVTSVLIQLNTVAIIITGVYMIKEMELTMGGLIAAVILSSRMIAPMGQVAGLIAHYQHTKTAYENLNNIMGLPVERPEGKKFVERPAFQGAIEFKDVHFSYPDAAKTSLNGVSFRINPGEKVGIIGKIGSGKSTVQKLLMGLYDPNEGSILVDGIDIQQIDPADLRRNMGYAPQDVVLFAGTVKENIVYKAPHASDAMILRASRIGGVHEFVDKHPQGFDLPVEEGGGGLSGGQRQSIAVARAFLLDAPLVLLDEPSNQMDNTTEARLIREVKKAIEDKTLILVTHKTSLLALVDRLIVMDEGKVVLDGQKELVLDRLRKK